VNYIGIFGEMLMGSLLGDGFTDIKENKLVYKQVDLLHKGDYKIAQQTVR
jgi:hypothetical protein